VVERISIARAFDPRLLGAALGDLST